MGRLLDLRKKSIEKVRVVEHIVFKPRSFKFEMVKMLSVIAIVTTVGFGISNADDIPIVRDFVQNKQSQSPETLSVMGVTESIDLENRILVIGNINGQPNFSYNVAIDNISINRNDKTQTKTFIKDRNGAEISLVNIEVGNTIIVKGFLNGDTISAHTVIALLDIEKVEIEIATTTLDVNIATSTDDVASTTIATSTTDATSTLDTATSTTDENVSTSTATSTDDTTTKNIIDTIIDITDSVIDTVKEIITTTTEIITGGTEPETEPTPEEPSPESSPEPTPTESPELQP